MTLSHRIARLEETAPADTRNELERRAARAKVVAEVRAIMEAPRPEVVPLEDRSAADLKSNLAKSDRYEKSRPEDRSYYRVMDWWRACVMGEYLRRQDVTMTWQEAVAFVEGVRKSRGGCSAEVLLEELDRKVAAVRLEVPIPGRPDERK